MLNISASLTPDEINYIMCLMSMEDWEFRVKTKYNEELSDIIYMKLDKIERINRLGRYGDDGK